MELHRRTAVGMMWSDRSSTAWCATECEHRARVHRMDSGGHSIDGFSHGARVRASEADCGRLWLLAPATAVCAEVDLRCHRRCHYDSAAVAHQPQPRIFILYHHSLAIYTAAAPSQRTVRSFHLLFIATPLCVHDSNCPRSSGGHPSHSSVCAMSEIIGPYQIGKTMSDTRTFLLTAASA